VFFVVFLYKFLLLFYNVEMAAQEEGHSCAALEADGPALLSKLQLHRNPRCDPNSDR
jgi:hypothetical protein